MRLIAIFTLWHMYNNKISVTGHTLFLFLFDCFLYDVRTLPKLIVFVY